MASLTIRNLSATPLELTRVERLDSAQVAALSSSSVRSGFFVSLSNILWALVHASWKLFGGSSNGSSRHGKISTEPPLGPTDITDVQIGPFETRKTNIRSPTDPKHVILRLTFAVLPPSTTSNSSSNGTAPATYHRDHRNKSAAVASTAATSSDKQTYTVILPPAAPFGVELTPVTNGKAGGKVDDGKGDGKHSVSLPAFTAIYTPEQAHLTIMSKAPLTTWMGAIDGSWPLSSLSLPGTHNSPACYRSLPSVRCQAVDVKTQLEHGVRFLDVRVGVNPTPKQKPGQKPKAPTDPRFTLVHAVWPVSMRATRYFEDLYTTVCDFLDAHPTETILISLKREGATSGTDTDLALQLLDYYIGQQQPDQKAGSTSSFSKKTSNFSAASTSRQSRWYTEPRVPTLDEVRGKIVLVRRFLLPTEDRLANDAAATAAAAATFKHLHGGHGWGLDASEWPDNCSEGCCGSGVINLQDFYGIMQTSLIDQKINYCRAQFERAANQCYSKIATTINTQNSLLGGQPLPTQLPPLPPLYINFLSGSNFFNSSCWPEKIAARVNPAVVEYLCIEHGDGARIGPDVNAGTVAMGDDSTGVVVSDWVGLDGDWDLIQCIIAWNARLQLKS